MEEGERTNKYLAIESGDQNAGSKGKPVLLLFNGNHVSVRDVHLEYWEIDNNYFEERKKKSIANLNGVRKKEQNLRVL